MADTMFLELISPEKLFASVDISSIEAMGKCGAFGIFPDHTPFFTELVPCVLTYTVGQETFKYALSGGFFEVVDNKVNVLASKLIPQSEVDKDVWSKEYERVSQALEKEEDEEMRKIHEDNLQFINILLSM